MYDSYNRIDFLMNCYHRQYYDFSNNKIGNDYYIASDEKVVNSIRSLSDVNRAYIVDIKSTFNTAEEAETAAEELYGHSSIYLSNIADKEMKDDTKDLQLRSLFAYAGEKVNSEYYNQNRNKTLWEDFQNNATYQKMERQGGTKSQSDVDELIVAAEEYRWQKAYKENDVYEQDMFDFAASFKERTGVTIVTNGFTGKLDFEMDGQLCKMDNYTFQLMAKNQEHMDIWDNMVSGTYTRRNWTLMARYRLHLRQRDNKDKTTLLNRTEHRGRLTFSAGVRTDFNSTDFGLMVSQRVNAEIKGIKIAAGVGYFHTDSYEARLYLYEQAPTYQFSFPMLYGEGLRYWLLARAKPIDQLTLTAKLGVTNYFDRATIGTDKQLIDHSSMTDLDLQVTYKF